MRPLQTHTEAIGNGGGRPFEAAPEAAIGNNHTAAIDNKAAFHMRPLRNHIAAIGNKGASI